MNLINLFINFLFIFILFLHTLFFRYFCCSIVTDIFWILDNSKIREVCKNGFSMSMFCDFQRSVSHFIWTIYIYNFETFSKKKNSIEFKREIYYSKVYCQENYYYRYIFIKSWNRILKWRYKSKIQELKK